MTFQMTPMDNILIFKIKVARMFSWRKSFHRLHKPQTPQKSAVHLAKAVRSLRLEGAWTKEKSLQGGPGITESSLKRFENSGRTSLDLLVKVAFALHSLGKFTPLGEPAAAKSPAEYERPSRQTTRKQGSK